MLQDCEGDGRPGDPIRDTGVEEARVGADT